MFGIGGSASASSSSSSSRDESRSQDSLAFADLFSKFYGGASATAGQITGQGLGTRASQLFDSGTGFLGSLMGGAGQDYLSGRVSGSNDVLGAQVGSLQESLGRMFQDQIMPGITSEAVGSGALGGGRQGVAQGRGISSVLEQFRTGVVGLMGQDQASRDQAAGMLMQGQAQSAQAGLGGLAGLLGTAQTIETAPLTGYAGLTDIMGRPTVLNNAWSLGTSASKSKSSSGSFSFGMG